MSLGLGREQVANQAAGGLSAGIVGKKVGGAANLL
jgi:hypothetical protein